MKDRIGFIAVGQAGGNIGQIFEAQGFSVLYLNTSMEDIKTIKGKHIYHIEHGEGANKDRDKAKSLVINDYDNIAKQIDDVLPDAELIYVIFAAGGGTGSGAGPMLIDLILGDKDVSVGAVTILPALDESVKAQMNAYECVRELADIENVSSCFFLDNQAADGDKVDVNYKFAVNEQFVTDFLAVINAPGKYISAKGNVDTAELFETLKCGGTAVVYSWEAFDIAEITNYPKLGYLAMPGNKGLKRALFIASEQASLAELYKTTGEPLDEYRGYSEEGEVVFMLAGMPFPTERLDKIYELVNGKKEMIISANKTQRCELKDFDFLSHVPEESRHKDNAKPQSRNDILKKYLRK